MSITLFDRARTARHRDYLQSTPLEISFLTIITAIVILIGTLGLIYLAHSNQVATKGYALKKLEHERAILTKDYGVWNMKVSEIKSLDYLKEKAFSSGMIYVNNGKFIRGNTAVAKK